MAALPALEKTWWTRANIPFPNTSTAADVGKSFYFNLKNVLINATTTGTASTTTGARDANSIWTVVSSSNGSTVSNTDLWGTTYSSSSLVHAASSSPHSWIVLQNSSLGYQMCIDLASATPTTARILFTKTSAPFTPTTTLSPSASAETFALGSATDAGPTRASAYAPDTTTSTAHYTHISVANTGEFVILSSRISTGYFYSFISFMKLSGSDPSDTRNAVCLYDTNTISRGAPRMSTIDSSVIYANRLTPNGSFMGAGGGGLLRIANAANTAIESYPIDSLTAKYNVFPLYHMCLNAQTAFGGRIPDIYSTHAATNISSIPSAAAQTRILANTLILPLIDVVPLT